MRRHIILLVPVLASIGACRSSTSETSPDPSVAVSSSAVAPSAAEGTRLVIDPSASHAEFLMDAPLEKIYGEVSGGISGELSVDLAHPEKLAGVVRVDLERLVLSQQKRADDGQAFGARVKNDLQNQHMKNWLEIGSDVPEATRERNRWATFTVAGFRGAASGGGTEATALHLNGDLDGELELHGHRVKRRVPVELVVDREAGKPTRLEGKTLAPVEVGLDDYDVRPREAFGKLAQATLETLGQKVVGVAPVSLTIVAKAN